MIKELLSSATLIEDLAKVVVMARSAHRDSAILYSRYMYIMGDANGKTKAESSGTKEDDTETQQAKYADCSSPHQDN